jgi:hypothetical protein
MRTGSPFTALPQIFLFRSVWSSAVYPTQAKKRLEWGTHLLLPVHSKFEVATTRQLSDHSLYQQQRLGAPFKPFFGLSGIHSIRPSGRPPFLTASSSSEVELRPKLQGTSIVGSRHLSEIRIPGVRIDAIRILTAILCAEFRVVEHIEEFKP